MPVPTSGFGKAVDKRASEMYFENAQVLATADSSILALGRSQGTGYGEGEDGEKQATKI